MPDTKNAHVRKAAAKSRRDDTDVHATEAARLLDDPAFDRAYNAVRDEAIRLIENHADDGSDASDDYERELCRHLRTLASVRRALTKAVNRQQLKESDFRPHLVKNDGG